MNTIVITYIYPVLIIIVFNALFLFQNIKIAVIGSLNTKVFNLSILGFSYFGLTVGFFVGLSSSSTLSAVLPALLTFIGGMMAYYFFGTNNSQASDNQFLSMIALISISIFLSLGAYKGIQQRKIYEISQKELEIDKEITLKKVENELKKDIIRFEIDLKKADTITFDVIPEIKK